MVKTMSLPASHGQDGTQEVFDTCTYKACADALPPSNIADDANSTAVALPLRKTFRRLSARAIDAVMPLLRPARCATGDEGVEFNALLSTANMAGPGGIHELCGHQTRKEPRVTRDYYC